MAINGKRELFKTLESHQADLRRLGVKSIGVFGSYVRDEPRAESDVDLLVEFEAGKKSFDSFMELSFFLEQILGKRVELLTRESLSPYIGPRILNEVEYASIGG